MATVPLKQLGATITIRIDRVYGKPTIYPACERAQLLAAIAGKKTLSKTDLAHAERMGFQIVTADSAAVLLAEMVRA